MDRGSEPVVDTKGGAKNDTKVSAFCDKLVSLLNGATEACRENVFFFLSSLYSPVFLCLFFSTFMLLHKTVVCRRFRAQLLASTKYPSTRIIAPEEYCCTG